MKLFHLVIFMTLPLFNLAQSHTIITELRLGGAKKLVPYSISDDAKFDLTGTLAEKNEVKVPIGTSLHKKEDFYLNRRMGTEIRFNIRSKYFQKNTIRLNGQLGTYLKVKGRKRKIHGVFARPIIIDLNKCDKLNATTYKMKTPIEIKSPAKYSLAKIITYLNEMLYNPDGDEPFYGKAVGAILEGNQKEASNDALLRQCAEVYTFIKPYFEGDSDNPDQYLIAEQEELKEHLATLEKAKKAAKGMVKNSIEQDIEETQLVMETYEKTWKELQQLKLAIDNVMIKYRCDDGKEKDKKKTTKSARTDFHLAYPFYSNGVNYNPNRFSLTQENIIVADDEANNTFSATKLTVMTNIYIDTKPSLIDIGIGVGIGVDTQDDTFHPEGYLGGSVAFFKRAFVINAGFRYSAVQALNPDSGFGVNDQVNIFPGQPIPTLFDTGYERSFFTSISISLSDLRSVGEVFSSIFKKSEEKLE